jgi:ribosome-binding factor A
MDERRAQRVSEALREELAEIIGFEMDDPRTRFVDVTEVHVSPDGRHARVKVGIVGTEQEQKQALAGLDHAKAFLRGEVARRLSLRRVPDLHFEHDRFPDADTRVDVLLKRARKTRGRE